MLKSLIVSLVIIFLSVFSPAYGKDKKTAFVRFVCFEEESVNRLVEADKIDRHKALLTLKALLDFQACEFDPNGRYVQIERTIRTYLDAKNRECSVITVKSTDGTEYYTLIQKSQIKIENKGLKV
jgi:hypothetical protein|tara:strand:- start:2525 stop:2899 length:375 start_codon:yes stop_codon:yes gene_type:complete